MASSMTHAWSSSDRPARTGLARIIGWSAVNRWGWRVRNHGCAHGSQNDRTPPPQTRRPVVLDLQNIHRHRIRSEEHTSELQSLMRISYAVFCLKKKKP